MRKLTINRRTLPFQNSKIEYEVSKNIDLSTDSVTVFTFKTKKPHGIVSPYSVVLVKTFNEDSWKERFDAKKYTHSTSRKYNVNVVDDFTFHIEFKNYELVEVENMVEGNQHAVLDILDRSIYECVNDTNNFIVKTLGKEYVGRQGLKWDSFLEEFTNEEDAVGKSIVFSTPFTHIKEKGYVFVKNTWHLKDNNVDFDDINITIYEDNLNLTSNLALATSECYKVGDDSVIVKKYLDEVVESVMPEIVDNEKRQFLPAINKGSILKLAQGIEINLHFRDRTNLDLTTEKKELTTSWKTTDEQIWNGFKIVGGKMERVNKKQTDDYADEVNCLGFTEDDVRYQKTKIKKSFIRLMFYSSKNLLDKELLYYSTIFLDSGRLYTTYCNIKNNVDRDGITYPAFDENRNDKDLRLDSKFTVNNKYDTKKSSEGFYLYLFPNEVKGENIPRTIYMKVEFNHAGYGKTIPMMLPRERKLENGKYTYSESAIPLKSDSEDFPITFFKIEENSISTDIERYTESIMIPVDIIYDKDKKSYLYYFPWYDRANENKIIINLWEPRMRGVINGNI